MYTDAQKRSHIFDLQTFLRRIQQSEGSAAPLVPDGIFGAQTAAAVREYQQQHCLPVTGIADQRTWNAIYASYAALIAADALPMQTAFFPPESDTVLKPGAKSPSVYVLQLMLSEIAPHYNRIAAVPLTGEYDSDTQAAVRRAQQIFQLPQTGPLHTADLVGHDVNLAIMETLYRETGDPKYRPHPLMRQMVRAGWLGVKTGKGFFDYDGPFGKEIVKK